MVSAAGGGASSMALDMTKPGKFQIAITAVNDKGIDAVKEKYILLVENDELMTTTWNTAPVTLSLGDSYAFDGTVNSVFPLDKLHISIIDADNTSVGIDYYRVVSLGGYTCDLSQIPAITIGELLTGLQVTNNQASMSLSSGSYIIRMWITDTQGNSSEMFSKTITVVDSPLGEAPVVEMLPVTEITASTAKLQAKVVDTKGGIIVNYGFNMYNTETGGERYAQYQSWATNPYYGKVTYDPVTGIISCTLQDYNPSRTYYAEGFAIYYQGDTEITGYAPERAGFTTAAGDIIVTEPTNHSVLSSAQVTVAGYIDNKTEGTVYSNAVIHIYDYQMTEIMTVPVELDDTLAFSTVIDMTDTYAGGYYAAATVDCDDSSIVSAANKFNIPGKLAVYLDSVDEKNITSKQATVTARVPDTQGETLVYYGFRVLKENGELISSYFNGHDEPDKRTTSYDPETGIVTGVLPADPDTTVYYEAFVSYKTEGVQVDSFSEEKSSFTTKAVDIVLDKINSYDGSNYKMDETVKNVKISGHISEIVDGYVTETPVITITDSKGNIITSVESALNGNAFSSTFDMSEYKPGSYTITATVNVNNAAEEIAVQSTDNGRVSYSNTKQVTIPNKASTIVFRENINEDIIGEILPQDQVITIAHWQWLVVDVEIDASRSDISKIEWITSDNAGLSLVKWNESDYAFDKARPQTCQLNAKELGTYTVTVNVYNFDGSMVSASLTVEVRSVAVLSFVDYMTQKPIQGATVTVTASGDTAYSVTAQTNEGGQIILYDIPKYVYCNVTAKHSGHNTLNKNYHLGDSTDKTILMYDDQHVVYSADMTALYTNGSETVTTHTNADILNTSATLDLAKKYNVSIHVVADESKAISEYQIIQKGAVAARSESATIVMYSLEKFVKNEPVKIRIVYSDGTYKDEPIQLMFSKTTWSNIKEGVSNLVDFSLGEEMSITVPSEVPIFSGHEFKLDLCNLPACLKKEGNKIFVTIGTTDLLSTKDDNNNAQEDDDEEVTLDPEKLKFSEEWDAFCNIVADAKNNGINKAVQDYSGKMISTKKPFCSGIDLELSVLGTFMYDLETGKGNLTFAIEGKMKHEKDYPAPSLIPGIPMVITLSLDGTMSVTCSGNKEGQNIDEVLVNLLDYVAIEHDVTFFAGYGAGMSYVGHLTINGEIKFQSDFKLNAISESYFTLGLGCFLRAKLLCWEYMLNLNGVTYRIDKDGAKYKWNKDTTWTPLSTTDSTEYLLSSINDISSIPASAYAIADRSYLNHTTDWYEPLPEPDVGLMSTGDAADSVYSTDVDTLMTYIYPDTQLQSVQTADHKVMVWLTDDATRSAANRTKLVYSVYDEVAGKWTTPQSVLDDGTLDSYPVLTTDGENIWAAWVNMNIALKDTDTLENSMLCTEICAGMFDPQTMSFRNVQTLTNNTVIDLNPSLAVSDNFTAVSWISNDSGNYWGTTGSNTIWVSVYENGEWSEAKAVKTADSAVTDAKIGFVGGELCVTYCLDSDNSYDTTDDISVYTIALDSEEEICLDTDGVNSCIQYVSMQDEQRLTWYSDGQILYISTADGEAVRLLGDRQIAGAYHLISDQNGTVLLTTGAMDGFSELYVSVYDADNDCWSNEIRLTYQNYAYINDFTAMTESNGDITVVYTAEAGDMAQMCSGTISFVKDVSLDSAAQYAPDAVPGQMTELYAEVTNHGYGTVENLVLRMTKDGETVSETNVETLIAAGETAELRIPVMVPETDDVSVYDVCILIPDEEEIDTLNNMGEVEFGYANLTLRVSDLFGEECRILTLEAVNNGGYDTGAVINIRKGSEAGEIIDTLTLETLAGKSYTVTQYILTDLSESVYIELVADRSEIYIGDNIVFYSLETDEILYGDVDSDGEVTDTDAVLLAQYFAGHDVTINTLTADMNGDNNLTRQDAMILARHIAGWTEYEELPYVNTQTD